MDAVLEIRRSDGRGEAQHGSVRLSAAVRPEAARPHGNVSNPDALLMVDPIEPAPDHISSAFRTRIMMI
jgi:hypothetical protein